jgi:hypothetical protein
MSTRSTVKFYSEFEIDKPLACVYHHFDGYIDGVGYDLANFLKSKTMINGINNQTIEDGFANGMGCLAAQYIKENKIKIGSCYLTTTDDSQDYNYEVRFIDGKFNIKVDNFNGTPDELLNCKEPES